MSPRDIDLATIQTWPADVTEERNGWFYLASGGVTGRVNAAWPLDWRGGDVDAAITDVEAWYAACKLPPRFKLTDGAVSPSDLPEHLTRRGYEPVTPTLIMTAPLIQRERSPDVSLTTAMPDAFDATLRRTAKDASEYDERHSIAMRAPQPAAFAMIEREGRAISIGLAASAGALAGVFLMRTEPEMRRQGLSRRILRALLAKCAEWGARSAFLQVEEDNAPAIALYESDGFTRLTTYRFWRKR